MEAEEEQTCERIISEFPSRSRNSNRWRHFCGWCSLSLSLRRFHSTLMIEEKSTVNVPLAISLSSRFCGGDESLHVASRTICSISV